MRVSLKKLAWTAQALAVVSWPAWSAGSESKQDVYVVNKVTEPVPVVVQGTTPVTGGVAVTNTPTVGLDPSQNGVQIVNPTTAPVIVRDTRQPFQRRLTLTIPEGGAGDSSEMIWVPAGQRIVIQHVTIQLFTQPLFAPAARLQVSDPVEHEILQIPLNFTRQEYGVDLDPDVNTLFEVYSYVVNQPVLACAHAETPIALIMALQRPLCSQTRCFGVHGEVVLSGYKEQVE